MKTDEKKIKNSRISVVSAHSVEITMNRLEATLKEKGMEIFSRIDHAANARKVDLEMPETQVLIFGNPKLGTKLMLAAPSIALDLPLKILVASGSDGSVCLSWLDPSYVKSFHEVEGCDEAFEMVGNALSNIVAAVAAE